MHQALSRNRPRNAITNPYDREAKARWGTTDFIRHYFFGRGRPVDLGAVGLLATFRRARSVSLAVNEFKTEVIIDAQQRARLVCRRQVRGRTERYTVRVRKATNVRDHLSLYAVGGSLLYFEARCTLDINCERRAFSLESRVDVTLNDAFVDAVDITNDIPDDQDFPGGKPYAIRAHWVEAVSRSGQF